MLSAKSGRRQKGVEAVRFAPFFVYGFTAVELVSVIALVGILAAVSFGRLMPAQGFDSRMAEDQLVSLARRSQQSAMSRTGVTLVFEDVGSEVAVRSELNSEAQLTRLFPENEVNLTFDIASSDGSQSCSALSGPVVLPYTAVGELSGAVSSAFYAGGFQVCVNGEAAVCIATSGFAHVGSCE